MCPHGPCTHICFDAPPSMRSCAEKLSRGVEKHSPDSLREPLRRGAAFVVKFEVWTAGHLLRGAQPRTALRKSTEFLVTGAGRRRSGRLGTAMPLLRRRPLVIRSPMAALATRRGPGRYLHSVGHMTNSGSKPSKPDAFTSPSYVSDTHRADYATPAATLNSSSDKHGASPRTLAERGASYSRKDQRYLFRREVMARKKTGGNQSLRWLYMLTRQA